MSELSINERLQKIENELDALKKKEKIREKEIKDSRGEMELKKEKELKEKKPRQKTAYNIFISKHILEEKERLGSDFKHKEAFSSGAIKWQEQKAKQ